MTEMKRRILEQTLQNTIEQIAKLDALPDEPMFEDGNAVIWFKKQFAEYGTTYTYAAVRAPGNGQWYVTGGSAFASRREGYTWDSLIEWIIQGTFYEIYSMNEFVQIVTS